MESPNRRYVPQIDELRAYAAIVVVVFHCFFFGHVYSGQPGRIVAHNPVQLWIAEGHTGVSLFLVLSGYILARGVWDREVVYWRFLRNRIIRIAPLMTFVVLAAAYTTGNVSLSAIAMPFLLLQNIPGLALNDPMGLAATVWTISVEFQLYLLAPFLFLFVRRHGLLGYVLPMLALLWLLRLAVTLKFNADPALPWQFPYFSIFGRLGQFLIGIVIAERWDGIARALRRPTAAGVLVAGLGLLTVVLFQINHGGGQYAWHPWRVLQPEIEGVLWGSILAGYVMLDPLGRVPKLRAVVRGIGVISFSIYLLHWSVFQGIFALLQAEGVQIPASQWRLGGIVALLILPCILAVSALSYWVIERPFLRLRASYVR